MRCINVSEREREGILIKMIIFSKIHRTRERKKINYNYSNLLISKRQTNNNGRKKRMSESDL